MRLGLILAVVALGAPALAQALPEITPEETAAAVAAVEAANLSDTAHRALWCAGSFAAVYTTQVESAELPALQQSQAARDALYRKAAVELLAAGMSEAEFMAIADNVYRVAVSQMRTGATAQDFTEEECAAAAAPASPSP